MGQKDIYNLLKEKNDWVLSREILNITKMSHGALYRILRILEKNNEITKEKAIKVIKEEERLNSSTKNAWAYKIKPKNK
jgi:CRISPR/Cas system CMR-associated protein Cmr1 (group 7 of RAMP superfamily)